MPEQVRVPLRGPFVVALHGVGIACPLAQPGDHPTPCGSRGEPRQRHGATDPSVLHRSLGSDHLAFPHC